jgi:hypothetical protein
MNNPIAPIPLFHTPDDMDALISYCECFSGAEKIVAITCAAMALNLAHKLVQQQIEGEAK